MVPKRFSRSAVHVILGILVTFGLTFAMPPGTTQAASPTVVISQVYGGGGNTGAVYTHDFIELHNRSGLAVSIAGWSVQYASATGSSWSSTVLTGTIQPGAYYLVQEAAGSGGTTSLPAPDASGSIAMSATAGKVALVSTTTALTGSCPTSDGIVDLVGYGSASCSESSPLGALSNTTAALRGTAGCLDTDNNSTDFAIGSPTPRNSTSTTRSCQYLLSVSVSPPAGGNVARLPDLATYLDGSDVQLTATPSIGFHFVGWSGDVSGTVNPITVAMGADRSVTANFGIDTHTLSVTTIGSGTVARIPDQTSFDHGSSVQLTAIPSTGWHFVGWSGDASGSANPLTVTMDADKSITATFAIDTHTLAVNTVGSGALAISPDQQSYDYGSSVQLTATPATGWHFVAWSGDASGNANPLTVTMDADKSIAATFAKNTVVVSQVYGGGGNTGATYTHDFIELFNRGTSAIDITGWTVQYAPAAGTTWSSTPLLGTIPPGGYYLVQEAQGAGGSMGLPTPDAIGSTAMSATAGKVALVNVNTALTGACPGDTTIEDLVGYGSASCSETSPVGTLSNTNAALRNSDGCDDSDDNAADFSLGAPSPRNSASPAHSCQHSLVVTVDPAGGGSVAKSPDQPSYAHGSTVQLTATQTSGYHFVNWSGDATGSANPLTLTMNSDKLVTAHFALNTLGGIVVISQVYGGGGNIGALYRQDFVELFNRGNAPVDITGWSVQYASASGDTWSSTPLAGTIQPGQYYLVKEAQGAGGTLDVPTPDAIGTSTMGANDGKVALVSDSNVLTGSCPGDASIVDFVGYGTSNCSEIAPAPALENVTAALRNSQGCDHVGNNALDFSSGTPAPRNSASPLHFCAEWLAVDPHPITALALAPVAPNPSHGGSRVSYALPTETRVRLRVLDLQGRVVATLVDGIMPAGGHEAVWNGSTPGGAASSGLYFVRLETDGKRLVRSVVLVR